MDRSSLNFVGSTYDLEKRQAFKAKLVDKIDSPQPKELPTIDNTFNGVSPGGILVHPSLGEGTLVEVDHDNNEVLIDFGTKGLIGLVLSQAKSFVHSPVKGITKGIAGKDDPFIGSEIQSRILAPQDRDFREVDFSKVVSPDFIEPEKTFIPAGSTVWHPELGACLVLGVDEKDNYISLSSESTGIVEMVLSQVRSKLRTIETPVDHVPMRPLVRESLAPQVPQYKSRGDVVVKLPEVFKEWQKNQQFMFLTRNQKLTTEQANDVFSVIEGNKPLFHSVTLDWQSQEETQATIIPRPKDPSINVDEARTLPSILDNKNLWHPDFGECSVFSIDGNQLILMTSVGQIPCVLDATVPRLAILEETHKVEHAPKRLGTKASAPVIIKDKVQSIIPLILPNTFNSWKIKEQYQYLTSNRHLTPEDANTFLAGCSNKFDIQWTNELPEANKRVEHKEQLLKRIEAASVEPLPPITPAPIDPGIRRVVEEVAMVKKEVTKKVPVDLPIDFQNWTSSGQYVFLTRTKQLTFNEANDILDILKGNNSTSNVEYIITWNGSPITQAPTGQRDIQETTEEVVEKKNVLKKISVTLPSIFKNWASSGQFGFLTRTRQLTFDEANDVLAVLSGNQPKNNEIKYEIVWSE